MSNTTNALSMSEMARAHLRLGAAFLNYFALPGAPLNSQQVAMLEALAQTLYEQGRHDYALQQAGAFDAATNRLKQSLKRAGGDKT